MTRAAIQRPMIATRPRGFVGVRGADAAAYLERMLSNDVVSLAPGGSCEALLLTPKARVVAPVRVLRRTDDDFLLLTEPELADVLRAALVRGRFAARCEIAVEQHDSLLLLGTLDPPDGVLAASCHDYGVDALELVDPPPLELPSADADELERLRILAGTAAWGREIDERVLPAEAGLVERAVSFQKGCYPGQEPIARLHYRGHVNRRLRRLRLAAGVEPAYDAEILHAGKPIGRLTSVAPDEGSLVALGYVRAEVPDDAELEIAGARATLLETVVG